MPINLLHHKSYHVYNSKNIERVKRDEQLAKEKEQVENYRTEDRERKERTRLLRERAGKPHSQPELNVPEAENDSIAVDGSDERGIALVNLRDSRSRELANDVTDDRISLVYQTRNDEFGFEYKETDPR
jgi:hypothetical protein